MWQENFLEVAGLYGTTRELSMSMKTVLLPARKDSFTSSPQFFRIPFCNYSSSRSRRGWSRRRRTLGTSCCRIPHRSCILLRVALAARNLYGVLQDYLAQGSVGGRRDLCGDELIDVEGIVEALLAGSV